MRKATDIKELILHFAVNDSRVRAVVLNGSRANPNVKPDQFQDFDVLFVVTDINSFIDNPQWIDYFGERMIYQLPDEGMLKEHIRYAYLMLFKDENRIDLTLFSAAHFSQYYQPDSLSIVWLDKDGLFSDITESSEEDYFIQKPTEKEFLKTCNEFWWVSTYVVKGLLRNEITYAKEMLEFYVRPMFMKMISWKIGIEHNFNVSFGKAGKNIPRYCSNEFYKEVLQTYSGHQSTENWQALVKMAGLFTQLSDEVSSNLGFTLNKTERDNTLAYIKNYAGNAVNKS